MSDEKLFQRIRSLYEPQRMFKGWCSAAKARELAELILTIKPSLVVEVGVYDGASLTPMVMAIAHLGSGSVVGIDPWCKEESLKGGVINPANIDHWSKEDYAALKRNCEYMLAVNKLAKWCRLIQKPSAEAVGDFADSSIGLLHLDGNHGAESAMQDVTLWMPKVDLLGAIVVDDVGWEEGGVFTVRPAVMYLMDHGWQTDHPMTNHLILRKDAS